MTVYWLVTKQWVTKENAGGLELIGGAADKKLGIASNVKGLPNKALRFGNIHIVYCFVEKYDLNGFCLMSTDHKCNPS